MTCWVCAGTRRWAISAALERGECTGGWRREGAARERRPKTSSRSRNFEEGQGEGKDKDREICSIGAVAFDTVGI